MFIFFFLFACLHDNTTKKRNSRLLWFYFLQFLLTSVFFIFFLVFFAYKRCSLFTTIATDLEFLQYDLFPVLFFCFKLRWVEYERARQTLHVAPPRVCVCVFFFAKLANWQNAVLRKVKQIVGTTVFAILSLQIVLCWVTFLLRRKQNHEKLCETEGKLSLIFSSLTLRFASLPYRYSNVKLTNESSNNKRKRKIKSNLYCVLLFLL